jgi:hypothetical protein
MAVVKKVAKAGKKAGRKVLETDAAQSLVGTVVDKLEQLVVDNADDVGEAVKKKAAKAGGRAPKSTTRKKSSGRKDSTKPASRKKTTARKKTAGKKTAAKKKSSTKK